ncbi:MAG: hypothetical protein QGH47_07720, partial [Candidatus Woesearchaeota archaeon]|nr:hypothetical protein [Candidatus Woesearchaeota archaeon]
IEALELLRVEKNGDDDPTDGNGDDRPEYVRMIDGVPPLDVFRIHQPRRMVHIPSRFTTHEGVYIDVLPNSQDQAKLLLSQVEETVRYARDHLPKGKKAPNDEQKKAINTLRTLHNQNFPPNALARFYIDAYRNLEFIDGLVGFLRSTSQDVMVLNQSYQRAACKFSYEASPGRECVQFKGETAIPVYAQNGQDQSRRRHFD